MIEQDAPMPLADEDRFHDIIKDHRFVKTLSVRDVWVVNRLLFQLTKYVYDRKLGRVFLGQIFDLGLGDDHQRMPELSFVSTERWPMGKRLPSTDPCKVVPDLVGLILNHHSDSLEVGRAVSEYRKAGVRLIWLIKPEAEKGWVGIFQGDPEPGAPGYRGLDGPDGVLDGGNVLPGFQVKLNQIFDEAA